LFKTEKCVGVSWNLMDKLYNFNYVIIIYMFVIHETLYRRLSIYKRISRIWRIVGIRIPELMAAIRVTDKNSIGKNVRYIESIVQNLTQAIVRISSCRCSIIADIFQKWILRGEVSVRATLPLFSLFAYFY